MRKMVRGWMHVRDRSCRLRCSLRLNARLQNWHLYFLSGRSEPFRDDGVDAADDGIGATLAPGIFVCCVSRLSLQLAWRTSATAAE